MSGRKSRDKGLRVEREIVNAHKKLGVHAERVPLSGASHYQGNGSDIDIYAFSQDEAPLVAEIKARQNGEGFALLERWVGENDLLFLKRNNTDPLVVLPWKTWQRLLKVLNGKPVRWTDGAEEQVSDETPEAGLSP